MENGTKFGQLILSKIIKIVATSCESLRPKLTKFDFSWGYAKDPAERAYSAPPSPSCISTGPTSRGEEGKEKGRKGKREEKGKRKVPLLCLPAPLQLAATGDAAGPYAA